MLVVHHRRAGGQSRYSALLDMDASSDRVQKALQFARSNLAMPLTVENLAKSARLSPRQFSRVFRIETGISPAKAIENLRLEAARLLLEQGRLPVEEIANKTGFGDRERMRRSFVRVFGQSPQSVRNASPPLASFSRHTRVQCQYQSRSHDLTDAISQSMLQLRRAFPGPSARPGAPGSLSAPDR